MPRETYLITIDRPADISITQMKGYISEAVELWKKGENPETDWFWHDLNIKIKRKSKDRA